MTLLTTLIPWRSAYHAPNGRVALVFAEGAGADADLVFGSSGTQPVILALGASAIAPLVSGPIALLSDGHILRGEAVAPDPLSGASLAYDNAVNRAPFRWAESPWNGGAAQRVWCGVAHRATRTSQSDARAAGGSAGRRCAAVSTVWQPMSGDRRPDGALHWEIATGRGRSRAIRFQQFSTEQRPAHALLFAEASPLPMRAAAYWRELFRRMRPALSSGFNVGKPTLSAKALPYAIATPYLLALHLPWEIARAPRHGASIPPVDPPFSPRYVGDPDLLFADAWPAPLHLVFGRPPAPRIVARTAIPVLRSYVLANDVNLIRVSNALSLPALSISLSIDADSWVWGWQASLPASTLDDVLPAFAGEPPEFEATVNGVGFRLLGERVTRDRRFAQARISVSGRGIAADLGAPHSPVVSRSNAADRSARQLMAQALTVNGIDIGWGIDWRITDWLIPAGAWSHSGSHIEACVRIAEAAGGYIQASRNSRDLVVLPRYPAPPWNWSGLTPDFALPSSAITRESVEWIEKPDYNAVYISGEGMGILGHVTRAGSAGDLVAPMIVDALTTHADAARQRGLAVLSNTGPQQILTLDTPVFAGIGIYPVGCFVAFSDGPESRLGIVRGLTINAALPTVRQTLEIECHE